MPASNEKISLLDHGFVRLVDGIDQMPPKKRRFRAPALQPKLEFLKALRASGSLIDVCKLQGRSRYSVENWRRKDEVFDAYVHEVLALWRGTNGERICLKCDEVKLNTEFCARSDRPGQQKSTCRACQRAQGRASYQRCKQDAFFRHRANHSRSRAQNLRVPFDLTAEFLQQIWTSTCPVFKTTLVKHADRSHEDAPELDRIIPSRGYVQGNVVWLSRRANRLKNNVSTVELRLLLSWLESVTEEALPCAA